MLFLLLPLQWSTQRKYRWASHHHHLHLRRRLHPIIISRKWASRIHNPILINGFTLWRWWHAFPVECPQSSGERYCTRRKLILLYVAYVNMPVSSSFGWHCRTDISRAKESTGKRKVKNIWLTNVMKMTKSWEFKLLR